jgi:hypothetical protein
MSHAGRHGPYGSPCHSVVRCCKKSVRAYPRALAPSPERAFSALVGGTIGTMTGADAGAGLGRQWHVALSFAGAQRDYVGLVAQALKARGVRCFYDADEEVGLWGRSLAEELPVIYGELADVVVVFVSADYAARDWTRLERRAALARAVRERREYVLPACPRCPASPPRRPP